ncbi:FkbM family methyltransferase [Asaia bogorensis]|uniref:FkbM family methyltransferase n=1 Tax=Asaia bogorensis TaxID=91915 RepID=UPI001968D28A|nr:FkbM family methyltransferase [Asaia bogorensis]
MPDLSDFSGLKVLEQVVQPSAPYKLTQGRYGAMLVNPHDHYIGQALLRYGEYGESELELLRVLVRGPGTIVEVGGNNGSQTVALAQAAKKVAGDLIVFEPQPFLFQNLCANLALNAIDNVLALPFACAAENGAVSFKRPDYLRIGNFGGVAMHHDHADDMVKVQSLKADEALQGRNVTLFKIDVEGFEREVLLGASKTISRCRPFLYIENEEKSLSQSLIEYLWSLGYRLWWHLPFLYNASNYRGNTENIYGKVVSCNMLCVPRESNVSVEGMDEVTDSTFHPFLV